jgi:hypothetical protein
MNTEKEAEFKKVTTWQKMQIWWQRNEKYISLVAFWSPF